MPQAQRIGDGAPRLGWYGDDFTGATDTLATLALCGVRALLFLGTPEPAQLEAAGALDAVGIAGAARSMTPPAMAVELAPAGAFLAALGVSVLHYKCCSTFDSAPGIGSIGAAVRALRPYAPNPLVPVLGGQPSLGRYCVFSTLFAAAGPGGEVHRLDRHPTMAVHPVTPMHEADLRLHLAAQGMAGIAAVHCPAYAAGAAALDARIEAVLRREPPAVLLDVAQAADLAPIGEVLWRRSGVAPLLAVGPSSVAQALAASWPGHRMPRTAPAATAARGPVFVMAGSLSPVTRRQVEGARSFTQVPADAARLVADPGYFGRLLEDVASLLGRDRSVLVRTAPDEGAAAAVPGADPAAVSQASARFVADLLRRVPLRRVGIAGGDTSSHAVSALRRERGLWGLSCVTVLAPGVALCRGHSDDPALDGIELMLKGGQMGPPDIFELLLHGG